MSLVVGDGAEVIMLNYILNKDTPENLVIKLYTNDYTPVEDDLVGNYTEISGGGYSSITFTPANWTIVPGDPSTATYPQVTWTFTGSAGLVYGYYIVRATGGELLWAERFSNGPYNMQNNGDQIAFTPTITLD